MWLTDRPWITRQSWPNPSRTLNFYPAGRQARAWSKIVLHSTETTGWPGYRNGADAPHFTIDPRTGQVRQHIPLDYGARALEIRLGNRLNNVAGVIQVEIIGAVTPGYPARYGHYDLVDRLPQDGAALDHLARLLRAISDATGIPLRQSVRWVKYPGSYGDHASQRLSTSAFLSYRGVLGHQHVPGNSHGDPGALPIADILRRAGATSGGGGSGGGGSTGTTGRSGDVIFQGARGDDVKAWQADLATVGYDPGPVDGVFGAKTHAATVAFQRDRKVDPDGRVGPITRREMKNLMANIEAKLDRILAALDGGFTKRPSGKEGTLEHTFRYHDRARQLLYAARGGLGVPETLAKILAAVSKNPEDVAQQVATLLTPVITDAVRAVGSDVDVDAVIAEIQRRLGAGGEAA